MAFQTVNSKVVPPYVRQEYPLLNALTLQYRMRANRIFEGLTLVIAQHLLPSISPLFQEMFAFGALPSQMFIIGKIYSTNPEIVNWLESQGCKVSICGSSQAGRYGDALENVARMVWKQVENESTWARVLIVDHGGFLRKTIPPGLLATKQIVAVEHTSRRFFEEVASPVLTIDMARSKVKKTQEPQIIATQVVDRLKVLGALKAGTRIGIIGCGTIGSRIGEQLSSLGYAISLFDSNFQQLMLVQKRVPRCTLCSSVDQLVRDSELIIGCTGRDSTSHIDWSTHCGNKILASASSGDIEFASLLISECVDKISPQSSIAIKRGQVHIEVLVSGFPVNFDPFGRTVENIDLTRALTFASALQAAELLKTNMIMPISEEFQDFFEQRRERFADGK